MHVQDKEGKEWSNLRRNFGVRSTDISQCNAYHKGEGDFSFDRIPSPIQKSNSKNPVHDQPKGRPDGKRLFEYPVLLAVT